MLSLSVHFDGKLEVNGVKTSFANSFYSKVVARIRRASGNAENRVNKASVGDVHILAIWNDVAREEPARAGKSSFSPRARAKAIRKHSRRSWWRSRAAMPPEKAFDSRWS
jgi:hypothetical protein